VPQTLRRSETGMALTYPEFGGIWVVEYSPGYLAHY
jgi:hypothetical protein